MSRIESNRRSLDLLPRLRRWYSPAVFGLETALVRQLLQHSSGALLDIGCGDMPYRSYVESKVSEYDGLDIEPRSASVKYLTSATNMGSVPSAAYDTVLSTEVLEHVERPRRVAIEIARVLRPGGTAIVSVPFLGRLHEEPRDFFRYTRHGLAEMFTSAGLEVQTIEETGSVASFLGHQVSTALVGLTWHVPLLKWIAFGVNLVFVVIPARFLDRLSARLRRKMPLGYVMVARKGA